MNTKEYVDSLYISLHEAQRFLGILFPNLYPDERVELRWKLPGDGNPMLRMFFANVRKAAAEAIYLAPGHEVYVGIGPRRNNVGTKEGVTRLPALWADLDCKGEHDLNSHLRHLDKLPCYPSMIVWSGGGIHPYWLLEECPKGSYELSLAEEVMARIAEGLGGDPVHDRSRILRVPGTLNHKRDEPRLVELVSYSKDRLYKLDQLEEMASSLPKADASTKTGVTRVSKGVLSDPICEGQRNVTLASVAGSLRDRGLDEETLCIVLCEINRLRCEPPLLDDEVERIATSVCRYSAGNPRYRRSLVRRFYPNREGR